MNSKIKKFSYSFICGKGYSCLLYTSVASVAPFAVITLLMANTVKTAQQKANAQWRRSMPPSCRRSKTTAMGRACLLYTSDDEEEESDDDEEPRRGRYADDDEESEDDVMAERIIPWAPPITAVVCALIIAVSLIYHSVSYTHLDVYKRQGRCLNGKQ